MTNFDSYLIYCNVLNTIIRSSFTVNCAPGFYAMSNGSCVPCPVGTYQPNEGSTDCLKCPYRLSKTEPGAVLESHCIDICKSENHSQFL